MTPATGQPVILVVEANRRLRARVVDNLTVAGFRVLAVAGAVEALERLRKQRVSLVVTNVAIPGIGGINLSRKIRRHYPNMPILFTADGDGNESYVSALSPGGALTSSFDISYIAQMVGSMLQKESRRRRRPRVLIVDRDRELRETLAEALDRNAYLPFSVAGRKEARRELENGEFDAVVANLESSDLDETTWLQALTNGHPDVPLIVTGESPPPPGTVARRLCIDAEGYLQKPYSASELITHLHRVISPDTAGC